MDIENINFLIFKSHQRASLYFRPFRCDTAHPPLCFVRSFRFISPPTVATLLWVGVSINRRSVRIHHCRALRTHAWMTNCGNSPPFSPLCFCCWFESTSLTNHVFSVAEFHFLKRISRIMTV
uniref:(northern house mosquito) hypothetical protein n=1 Tax=Culex pipiens TaxID=7175 RepID=A0A8D8BM32_CULPI